MSTLKMRKEDGTLVEIEYKPTSRDTQSKALYQYYVHTQGWRPSEAAMQVGTMKPAKLRKLYQGLVMLGEVKQ